MDILNVLYLIRLPGWKNFRKNNQRPCPFIKDTRVLMYSGTHWPLWYRLLLSPEQPAPQQPGILRDNQLMKSKFEKMTSDQFLFLQHMLSAAILNQFFEFRTWITSLHCEIFDINNILFLLRALIPIVFTPGSLFKKQRERLQKICKKLR